MALEERILVIPGRGHADRYQAAHPDFRAILTSNPEDYAGITEPQDALIDRLITFDFDYTRTHRRSEKGLAFLGVRDSP